ncbi:MAG TPA: hypothetical protein PLT32_00910 [bacterium]|nr:hypothetical protein [bacterium]
MRLFFSKILNFFYLATNAWRAVWSEIWHNRTGRWLIMTDLFLLLLSWSLSIAMVKLGGEGLLILHYNIHFGIDLIGSANSIYWLPTGATIAFLVNSFILPVQYNNNRQLKMTILGGSLAVLFFINLALSGLLLINFR